MTFYSLISSDRKEIVDKIHNEMSSNSVLLAEDTYDNNNSSNTKHEEILKNIFLSLVSENKELLENEKEYCKEKINYYLELNHATYKIGEPTECKDCKSTRYSIRLCEGCIRQRLKEL